MWTNPPDRRKLPAARSQSSLLPTKTTGSTTTNLVRNIGKDEKQIVPFVADRHLAQFETVSSVSNDQPARSPSRPIWIRIRNHLNALPIISGSISTLLSNRTRCSTRLSRNPVLGFITDCRRSSGTGSRTVEFPGGIKENLSGRPRKRRDFVLVRFGGRTMLTPSIKLALSQFTMATLASHGGRCHRCDQDRPAAFHVVCCTAVGLFGELIYRDAWWKH